MPLARRTRRSALAAATGVAVALAGCSNGKPAGQKAQPTGSATASMVDGIQQVTVHATDFRFHPATITVHPGKVRIVLVNDGGGAPHDWQLPEFPSDGVPLASNGQTKETTFTAPAPGRYQFVCTIHTKQGMVGTLVVLPN